MSARPGDRVTFFTRPKPNVSRVRRPGAVRAQPCTMREGERGPFFPNLRVRIKDNNSSPHGKLYRFLFPFSSKFPDLNFASYILYIYLCGTHSEPGLPVPLHIQRHLSRYTTVFTICTIRTFYQISANFRGYFGIRISSLFSESFKPLKRYRNNEINIST